jgi:hypothetical protein
MIKQTGDDLVVRISYVASVYHEGMVTRRAAGAAELGLSALLLRCGGPRRRLNRNFML